MSCSTSRPATRGRVSGCSSQAGGGGFNLRRRLEHRWRSTLWRWQQANGDVQAVRFAANNVYFGFHDGFGGNTTLRLLAADAVSGARSRLRPRLERRHRRHGRYDGLVPSRRASSPAWAASLSRASPSTPSSTPGQLIRAAGVALFDGALAARLAPASSGRDSRKPASAVRPAAARTVPDRTRCVKQRSRTRWVTEREASFSRCPLACRISCAGYFPLSRLCLHSQALRALLCASPTSPDEAADLLRERRELNPGSGERLRHRL